MKFLNQTRQTSFAVILFRSNIYFHPVTKNFTYLGRWVIKTLNWSVTDQPCFSITFCHLALQWVIFRKFQIYWMHECSSSSVSSKQVFISVLLFLCVEHQESCLSQFLIPFTIESVHSPQRQRLIYNSSL